MDPTRFDSLAKALAVPGSRRRLLAGLAAGALGVVGRRPAGAADCPPGTFRCLDGCKICPPGQVAGPILCRCVSPTTTTSTTTSTTTTGTTSTTTSTTTSSTTTGTTSTTTTPPPFQGSCAAGQNFCGSAANTCNGGVCACFQRIDGAGTVCGDTNPCGGQGCTSDAQCQPGQVCVVGVATQVCCGTGTATTGCVTPCSPP